jgi:3-oxoadipate enol-lactonase
VFDHGCGPPVIVVPGVQGRWEWMRPSLDALSTRCRAISYSLSGDFGSGYPMNPALGFDNYLRQLDAIVSGLGVQRAVICGVSYGGMIALRYAATRPERVSGMVLVSAPAPGWRPSARQAAHIARPWVSTPAFLAAGPFRLWPEIRAALPERRERVRFAMKHGVRVLLAPSIPSLMALRVHQQQALDFRGDCDRVQAPTLIVTGEEGLDTVVPVHVTERYREFIPSARYVKLDRTGHIGMITQPERFAELVSGFAHANHH